MKIADFDLDKEILVVAEIGNNHEGDFALAQRMIREAARTGVQAVKFQTIRAESLVSSRNVQRYKQLKAFEFTQNQFIKLSEIAAGEGLIFLSTPFDIDSVDYLNEIVPVFKIASGDNNFFPLLERVAGTGKPVFISCGISDIATIRRAKTFIEKKWKECNIVQEIAVLHCVSSYPVPIDEVNLNNIGTLKKALKCTVGYSDHSLGIESAVLSVALGARIIEKHFTLDKNYSSFRDHQLSADPPEMKKLVERVKSAAVLLGSGRKEIQDSEANAANLIRRSIAAKHDLIMGKTLELTDIKWIREPGGLSPGHERKVVGKVLKVDLSRDEVIIPGKHLK
jgi:N,N'-diacetyllegionaminate synthase